MIANVFLASNLRHFARFTGATNKLSYLEMYNQSNPRVYEYDINKGYIQNNLDKILLSKKLQALKTDSYDFASLMTILAIVQVNPPLIKQVDAGVD